jgi:hypothetical protein
MAHFFRPQSEPATGVHVDGKLAPDSVWKLDVLPGKPRLIGLFEGNAQLTVKSNNPGVVGDDFKDRKVGANRFLTILGSRVGTSLIEVRQGTQYWFCLQVEVQDGVDVSSKLSGSVGRAGQNRPADVKIVQKLLNEKMPIPFALLEVNGICNDLTILAIENYQRRVLGRAKPDGRVDPGGGTLKSLLNGSAPAPARPEAASPTVEVSSGVAGIKEPRPQIIREGAWKYLLEFTTHHEFPVLHMYNNRTKPENTNDVTCGIGHLLDSERAAVDAKDMFFDPATKATPSDTQLKADWNTASGILRKTFKDAKGRTRSNLDEYAAACVLRMHPDRVFEDMAKKLKQKLNALMTHVFCRDDFADFKNFPSAAQVFSVSFAYAIIPGTKKGAKDERAHNYPALRAAIRAKDWAIASRECQQNGGSPSKNAGHTRLLLFAQQVKDTGLPLETLPQMFK